MTFYIIIICIHFFRNTMVLETISSVDASYKINVSFHILLVVACVYLSFKSLAMKF